MKTKTDPELVEAAISGSEESFEMLVLRYCPAMIDFAYRYLGDRKLAEDVSQEVFIKAYRKLGKCKPSLGFANWLYRIALNTCRDIYRTKHYHKFEITEISSTLLIEDGKIYTIGSVHSKIGVPGKDASNKKYAQIVAITSKREQTGGASLDKFNIRIPDLSFTDATFESAMDWIREYSKINIIMTADAKERLKDTMVNLKLTDVSIKDLLRFVCLEAGVNTYIIDKNGNVIIE